MLPGVAGTSDCKKPTTMLTISLECETETPEIRYSVIAMARETLLEGIWREGVDVVSYSKPQYFTLCDGGEVLDG